MKYTCTRSIKNRYILPCVKIDTHIQNVLYLCYKRFTSLGKHLAVHSQQ